ncbi:unnamed protein product [Mytilus coruscus]|uniref:Uncharacterized protein n=1 Tax=Mytilus coruscus TaxID=42192 RepID=A0A6J8BEU1_MYTCO|nr:unnamed protein product [Mytilus coruscus]
MQTKIIDFENKSFSENQKGVDEATEDLNSLFCDIADKDEDQEDGIKELLKDIDKTIKHVQDQGICVDENKKIENTINDKLGKSLSYNSETDKPITMKEIKLVLNKLKKGKSSRPDGIINKIIKHSSLVTLTSISKLFNLILKSGIYPAQWNKSYLTLLHKSGTIKGTFVCLLMVLMIALPVIVGFIEKGKCSGNFIFIPIGFVFGFIVRLLLIDEKGTEREQSFINGCLSCKWKEEEQTDPKEHDNFMDDEEDQTNTERQADIQ